MAVLGIDFEIKTKGENHIINITADVEKMLLESGLKEGIACVFVGGSTGAITTMEFEPGLLEDMPVALERLVPKRGEFKHHLRWNDGNGHSHVRAAILGPSVTVPFRNCQPVLGTWQQIIFIELDVKPRTRTIYVQMVGE
ncbi:MAG: secondary thiamine-phosphate synthase enzyme YjbQ [Candidatus Thermoplasmatota archaeon]|nr:YjbQ family protein [Euryarchaeota archaeon]MBU4031298.1 secondary thiamine-phosphate synthase enzyme YjbQ [Candidatus Thermoplasmatota archaeon]MBU4070783.1 secondary thiamine-phosphate synthase enzyme YjbQ [Candidatus Thermoplasmatota archaeon]MBU4144219.1 secondary thiamine-phosphate synthase enzyme YjbQ [Candidatus Thermoplasmatota archaeon]MBU4590965.1 secondary thiamine-phosphate synthase enzyme YjbQ [Candidatus Thermoplasmatota archaeon]